MPLSTPSQKRTMVRPDQGQAAVDSRSVVMFVINRLLPVFLVYLVIALYFSETLVNAGLGKGGLAGVAERSRVVIAFGIRAMELGMVVAIGSAFVLCRDYRQLLFRPAILAVLAFLALYTVYGILHGNELGFIRKELHIWGWFFGGMGLFSLLLKTGQPKLHLILFLLIASGVLYYAAIETQTAKSWRFVLEQSRLWDPSIFRTSNLIITLLGLTIGLCALRTPFQIAALAVVVSNYFYCTVLMGANRGLTIVLGLCLALASLGLLFQRNDKEITTTLNPKGVTLAAVLGVLVLLVGLTLSGWVFADSTALSSRLWSSQGMGGLEDRVNELSIYLREEGWLPFLWGGGLGATFDSQHGYRAVFFHLGVFTYLLKFGVLPTLLLVLFLYVYVPLRYLRALLGASSLSPFQRTAMLIIFPSFLCWLASMTVSGGYSEVHALNMGLVVAAYFHLSRNGLQEFAR